MKINPSSLASRSAMVRPDSAIATHIVTMATDRARQPEHTVAFYANRTAIGCVGMDVTEPNTAFNM